MIYPYLYNELTNNAIVITSSPEVTAQADAFLWSWPSTENIGNCYACKQMYSIGKVMFNIALYG